ncbi:FMN reductase [Cellulomonas taurus]|uniref:FMN reductase n=1 Tax=Cellulomonas taurus TaxID=2729175 RepID=UPI00145DFC60|nr:FMN reductase [Cellulomonas taurus]
MTTRRIVAISAGLSQPSSTRLLADRLAEATRTELGAQGVPAEVQVIELRDVAHDIINAMLTGGVASQALTEVIEAVTGADGLIAVTPLFTTTYSGLFKSFIDILDKDSITGLPVLIGATGGTPRHSLALEYSIRPLFTYLRADVATTTVFAATDDWAAGSTAGEPSPLPTRIARAGTEFARTIAARDPRTAPEDPFAGTPDFASLLGG